MKLGIFLFFLLFTLGYASFVAAESRGIFYIGGGEASAEQDEFDATDSVFKIGSGFQVTENSSIEIYWARFEEATDTVNIAGLGESEVVEKANSIAFQYAHFLSLGGYLDLIAKAGLVFWKTETGVVGSSKVDDDGVDFIVGAGVQVNLNTDWALRAEWELTQFDDTDINLVSAGIVHYFD